MSASEFGLVIRQREHPTELARGRLEYSYSEPIIQSATAILQVAPLTLENQSTEIKWLAVVVQGDEARLTRFLA
jgi:hypothetical protein